MKFSNLISGASLAAACFSAAHAAPSSHDHHGSHGPITPKAFIIAMVRVC
jgi:hypothetical protein